ncbi:MAG: M23 family metallopeptidase [Candidatus Peribacteraceae bacterium]|nr:M23 family metallopeptidase [Candidatus Peribacteraceae bacterium]
MLSISKRKFGFTSTSVYRRREPHAFTYLSERATFWIAVLSVFAFVTGNMIGQHGWAVFWKSVMGEGSESTIVFTGMVSPLPQIPDYERWSRLGGDVRTHTFRQVPKDILVPLPRYVAHGDDTSADPQLRRVYFTEHLGTYATGRGKGSHPGEDISVPQGTPVVSVANGIVLRVGEDAGGFGTFVVIKHPNVPDAEKKGEKSALFSVYAHLSEALVQEGITVMKGDQIGLSGKTGNASAPHLHFQMENAKAPFHPYWPFTGAEQRDAKMTFSQAVDQGLNRDRALDYMLDPMLAVQTYQNFTGPVIAAATPAASSSSPRKVTTIADRRQMRLSKIGTSSSPVTLIAFTETAPVIPIPTVITSPASSSAAARVGIGAVRSVRISHDGAFNKTRGWEKVTLMLLDADSRVVTAPTTKDAFYLRTAFGRAEFRPAMLTAADFLHGVAHVEMLPLGDQSVVIRVEPTGDMSTMRYDRS